MNPEIKSRWVAALRSGEFQQGTGALRHDDRFCCLGVLCAIAQADGIISSRNPGRLLFLYGTAEEIAANGGRDSLLPDSVVRWAELPDVNPHVFFEDKTRQVADLNDHGGSFAVIADLIEEQL